MKSWINALIIILAVSGIHSCGKKLSGGQDKLPKIKEERLIEVLDSIHRSGLSFLSARIDTKYADSKQNVSFKTSLKIDRDSAVHALITYAGIPIVTAMITNDSVKISNKREKCYVLRDLDFFRAQFGVGFSYRDLEELLLGRPLRFNPEQEYFLIHDPYNYSISTQKEGGNEGELLISYHLTPDLKHLKRVEITSFRDEVSITVNYHDYGTDPVFSAPRTVSVQVKSPKNEIFLTMTYDKVELNVPKEMVIVIPDSYESCK